MQNMSNLLKNFGQFINESSSSELEDIADLWKIGVVDDRAFISFLNREKIDPKRFFSPKDSQIAVKVDEVLDPLDDLVEWQGPLGEWIILGEGTANTTGVDLNFLISNGLTINFKWDWDDNLDRISRTLELDDIVQEVPLSKEEHAELTQNWEGGETFDDIILYLINTTFNKIKKDK
jgi:hypothetical protein